MYFISSILDMPSYSDLVIWRTTIADMLLSHKLDYISYHQH